jgi:PLP dependent protein
MTPEIQTGRVFDSIKKSALISGRKQSDITVVAVTKAFPVSLMNSAYEAGFSILGESRVQETEKKLPEFKYLEKSELHLIGHLQSNKVKKAIEIYDVIQSVDSIKIAGKINRVAALAGKSQKVFLQVNTGNDPAKHGYLKDDALAAVNAIIELENISLLGLMVVAPLTNDEKSLRKVFSETRILRDKIRNSICPTCKMLSMGMSGDFSIAIEEGATHVRIGSALFGERPQW